MNRAHPVLLVVLGLPLCIAGVILGPAAFDLVFHRRPPERFLIPEGYRGWVRVDFRQKDKPPLPMEDGHYLLKLDEHGNLKTSSDPLVGHGRDDFFTIPLIDVFRFRTRASVRAAWCGKWRRWWMKEHPLRLCVSSWDPKANIVALPIPRVRIQPLASEL